MVYAKVGEVYKLDVQVQVQILVPNKYSTATRSTT